MVPVQPRGLWHEEQMDELFASLVGHGFDGRGSVGGNSVDAMDLGGEETYKAVQEMGLI